MTSSGLALPSLTSPSSFLSIPLTSHTQLTLCFRNSPPSPPPGGCRAHPKDATSFFQKSVVWSGGRAERPCGEGVWSSPKRQPLCLWLQGEAGSPLPGLVSQPERSLWQVQVKGLVRPSCVTPSSWTEAEEPLPGASGLGPLRFPRREGGSCHRASCICGKPHTAACRCKGPGGRGED